MHTHTHERILHVVSLGQKFHPALELPGSHDSARFSEMKKNEVKKIRMVPKY